MGDAEGEPGVVSPSKGQADAGDGSVAIDMRAGAGPAPGDAAPPARAAKAAAAAAAHGVQHIPDPPVKQHDVTTHPTGCADRFKRSLQVRARLRAVDRAALLIGMAAGDAPVTCGSMAAACVPACGPHA